MKDSRSIPPLKIYLVQRPAGSVADYDDVHAYVVIAKSHYQARNTHPRKGVTWDKKEGAWRWQDGHVCESWPVDPKKADLTFLGYASTMMRPGVVCVDSI